MRTVKALAKGQMVIPSEIRKKYRIKPGTEMQILEYGSALYLIPPLDDPISAACGILPPKPSVAKKLLKERCADFKS
jgi:AbrB family looped-hinge helix DNA binding protein